MAVSHDEVNLGASAVAAPIRTGAGVGSSVAVIATAQRFDDAMRRDASRDVRWAAERLGSRLGDPLSGLEALQ